MINVEMNEMNCFLHMAICSQILRIGQNHFQNTLALAKYMELNSQMKTGLNTDLWTEPTRQEVSRMYWEATRCLKGRIRTVFYP